MKNHTSNEKTEKLTSADALQLIFTTANASGLEHERINPTHVVELTKTLGRWKQTPKIVTTPRGVVIHGVDYLAALAGAGRVEAEVVIDRTASAPRREQRKPTSLVEQLTKAGIQDAAFKLAVYRRLKEGEQNNPETESPKQLVDHLSDPKFLVAFESLKAPYDLISTKGLGKVTRVRSKIVFASFLLAYHANPKLVVQLYTDFLSNKVKEGSPLEKLLYAAKHDNINTGSGRRPFMLKASILLAAQLAGEKIERALADEVRGQEVVSIFLAQHGNA